MCMFLWSWFDFELHKFLFVVVEAEQRVLTADAPTPDPNPQLWCSVRVNDLQSPTASRNTQHAHVAASLVVREQQHLSLLVPQQQLWQLHLHESEFSQWVLYQRIRAHSRVKVTRNQNLLSCESHTLDVPDLVLRFVLLSFSQGTHRELDHVTPTYERH